MTISDRDRAVVQLVARFKQATSRQIYSLLFHESASITPCNRTLRRLTEQEFLRRVERRIPGGGRGGSGQYVYSLGRRGFYEYFGGNYQATRTVNYHTLAILDCYVTLRALERLGGLQITATSTEPDCWVAIAGIELKPDLYVELLLAGTVHKLWLEMDMGTETQKQLLAKLETYRRAFNDADAERWPVFPRTVWVGVDQERAKELAWLIGRLPRDQELFQVTTRDRLRELFGIDHSTT